MMGVGIGGAEVKRQSRDSRMYEDKGKGLGMIMKNVQVGIVVVLIHQLHWRWEAIANFGQHRLQDEKLWTHRSIRRRRVHISLQSIANIPPI